MSSKRKFVRLSLLYLLLIVGYLYLHVVDIDQILFPGNETEEVKSKIDFVYQQY